MKRKLTSILLMSALLVGGASTFVSCKDYDGDQAAVTNANVKGLSDKLNEQIAALEAVKVDLAKKADKTYVDDLIADIDETIADLTDVVNGHTEKLIEVEAAIVDIDGRLGNLEDFEGQVKSLFGKDLENVLLKGSLADYAAGEYASDFLGAMVTSLNNALAAAGTENFTDVFELFAYLDKTIPAELKDLASKCAYLAGQDALLNSRIDSLVTGVNVDMVSNPIYGTFNTPFGIKNYVLAGFVGGQIEGQEFAGQDVEGGLAASANGGSIYLTVNPTDLDAEGWNIGYLVGRDGKQAPGYGKLVLVADNTPVTTTKAAAQGGYVATPELVDPAAAKINVNKEELAAVAKNVLGKLRGEEALDITGAVQTIYNTFSKAIDQYYGINVKYGKNGEHSFQSSYDIAPVTVKPLAYTTLADKNFRDIPQIPSLQDKLGAIISKIEYDPIDANSIKDFDFVVTSIANPDDGDTWTDSKVGITVDEDAKTITIPYFDDTTQKYAYKFIWDEVNQYWQQVSTVVNKNYSTITIPYSKIKIEKVNVLEDGWSINWTWAWNAETGRVEPVAIEDESQYIMKYTVTISHDELKSIVNEINTQMSGIVGDVNKMFDKVSDLAGAADGKLALVNKLINKTNYTIDNINQYLQPIALAVCEGKAVRLSEVPGCYTQFKVEGNEGSIVLAPTSYTLELLAPAYKKSIKVDNKELNPTLDGSVKTVDVTLGVGNHTITVSSMDFYGNVVTKNYYVQVVK